MSLIHFSLNNPDGVEQVGRMPHYVVDIINSSIVFKASLLATFTGWTGLAVSATDVESWLRIVGLLGTVLVTFSTLFMIWYKFLHGKKRGKRSKK